MSVAPAREENTSFTLEKSTGSASFRIRPAGVNCLVDGKFIGKVQGIARSATETHLTVIENLSPGVHTLTISHPRANPLRRDIRFTVVKGQRYVCKEDVNLWISNCEITFKDGKVEAGMILGETETDFYYSPARGIKYMLSKSFVKKVKYIPVTEK